MDPIFLWYVKLTGYPLQYFFYRKKVLTEDGSRALKDIKGSALIVSNHTSVMDYPLVMYAFLKRNLRVLVAEVIYNNGRLMAWFLKKIGCIRVDRDSRDFSFVSEAADCLRRGGLCLVYPESRLPVEGEEGLLPFKPSYVLIALESGAPIIPGYTNGVYGKMKKAKNTTAKLMIGRPVYASDLTDPALSEKENIDRVNSYVKGRIEELALLTDEQR